MIWRRTQPIFFLMFQDCLQVLLDIQEWILYPKESLSLYLVQLELLVLEEQELVNMVGYKRRRLHHDEN